MLTEVKAYSAWQSAPTMLLDADGRSETDFLQIRNIDGLDPVKASVNTSPFGSVHGESYAGSSVPSRNIVLTIGLNPDWDTWSYEQLRRLVYQYFMPSRPTRLVFYSDDIVPVEIVGIVEDVNNNQFSKDPELLVSIICPDPYFTALNPTVLTGQAIRPGGVMTPIELDGNVGIGIQVKVTYASGSQPTEIGIQIGEPTIQYFTVEATVDIDNFFEMSSIPMRKYVQNVEIGTGIITNLLSLVTIEEGSSWPTLHPIESEFGVITDQGVQDWELTYFERFGGL